MAGKTNKDDKSGNVIGSKKPTVRSQNYADLRAKLKSFANPAEWYMGTQLGEVLIMEGKLGTGVRILSVVLEEDDGYTDWLRKKVRQLKDSLIDPLTGWIRDLTREGVESNPGPDDFVENFVSPLKAIRTSVRAAALMDNANFTVTRWQGSNPAKGSYHTYEDRDKVPLFSHSPVAAPGNFDLVDNTSDIGRVGVQIKDAELPGIEAAVRDESRRNNAIKQKRRCGLSFANVVELLAQTQSGTTGLTSTSMSMVVRMLLIRFAVDAGLPLAYNAPAVGQELPVFIINQDHIYPFMMQQKPSGGFNAAQELLWNAATEHFVNGSAAVVFADKSPPTKIVARALIRTHINALAPAGTYWANSRDQITKSAVIIFAPLLTGLTSNTGAPALAAVDARFAANLRLQANNDGQIHVTFLSGLVAAHTLALIQPHFTWTEDLLVGLDIPVLKKCIDVASEILFAYENTDALGVVTRYGKYGTQRGTGKNIVKLSTRSWIDEVLLQGGYAKATAVPGLKEFLSEGIASRLVRYQKTMELCAASSFVLNGSSRAIWRNPVFYEHVMTGFEAQVVVEARALFKLVPSLGAVGPFKHSDFYTTAQDSYRLPGCITRAAWCARVQKDTSTYGLNPTGVEGGQALLMDNFDFTYSRIPVAKNAKMHVLEANIACYTGGNLNVSSGAGAVVNVSRDENVARAATQCVNIAFKSAFFEDVQGFNTWTLVNGRTSVRSNSSFHFQWLQGSIDPGPSRAAALANLIAF